MAPNCRGSQHLWSTHTAAKSSYGTSQWSNFQRVETNFTKGKDTTVKPYSNKWKDSQITKSTSKKIKEEQYFSQPWSTKTTRSFGNPEALIKHNEGSCFHRVAHQHKWRSSISPRSTHQQQWNHQTTKMSTIQTMQVTKKALITIIEERQIIRHYLLPKGMTPSHS